jgi:ERCC4-type nuclease
MKMDVGDLLKELERFEERYAEFTVLFINSMKEVSRELRRSYPDITAIARDFEFGIRMFKYADEEVIRFLGKVKEFLRKVALKEADELISRLESKLDGNSDGKVEIDDFEEWYHKAIESLDNVTYRNILSVIKDFGGVILFNKLKGVLRSDHKALSHALMDLEKRGFVKFIKIPFGGKFSVGVVYFNHPRFTKLSLEQLVDFLDS